MPVTKSERIRRNRIADYRSVISRTFVGGLTVRRFAFEGEAAMGVVCFTRGKRVASGPKVKAPVTHRGAASTESGTVGVA